MLKLRHWLLPLIATIILVHPTAVRAEILVASFLGNAILRFDEVTGAPLAPLVNPGGIPSPACLAVGPDNMLYVSSQASFQGMIPGQNDFIYRVDPFTPGATPQVIAMLPNAYSPAGIAFNNGKMFVSRFGVYGASVGNETVDRYTMGGVFEQSVVTSLSNPTFLAFDSASNLYVSNFNGGGNGSVKKFNGTTTTDFIAGPTSGGLQGPADLTFSGGNLYVVDQTAFAVRRYDATTGIFVDNFLSGGVLTNDFPNDMLFDRQGQMLLTTLGSDLSMMQSDVLRFNALTGAQILPSIITDQFALTSITLTPVPEPSSIILAGVGLAGYAWRRRRRASQK